MTWTTEKSAILSFSCAILLVGLVGTLAYRSLLDLTTKSTSVTRTLEVQEQLGTVLSLLKDAETGQRGYIITGKPRFLEPYQAAELQIELKIDQLRQRVADNQPQQQNIARLELLIDEAMAFDQQAIQLRKTRGFAFARDLTASERGKQTMDELRRLVDEMKTVEQTLLEQKESATRQGQQTTQLTIIGGSALACLIIFTALIIVLRGFAARQKINRERDESESRYQAILNTTVDAIIVIDKRGRVQSFNTAAETLFGYRATEVIGHNVNMLQPEPYHSQHDDYLKNYMKTKTAKIIGIGREVVGLRKDGSTFPLDLAVSEVHVGNKRLFTGIIRDITARKEAEANLLAAKESAETANHAKSDFLASMSHEIRTPMNAIIGMADLLAETDLNQEQQEYVGIFQSAGENLLNIINDILDISKVEAGQLELEQIPFNLNEVMEKTCEIIAVRAHEKGLELTCSLQSGVPESLIGDPLRLRQVLINLLGNAVKFTDQGEVGVKISRSATPALAGQVALLFTITDTGIGIPQDKQASIFERFSQVDVSTTRSYGGTGLGLSICQQIVTLMGGEIQVESAPGEGSSFAFSALLGEQRHPRVKETEEPRQLAGLRALIIDDNSTNRLVLQKILKSWQLKTASAEDGNSGLAEMERAKQAGEPYHLVLLDCRMPEMDGFEVAEQIKQNSALPGATLMMLTSDNRSGDIARSRELGISEYLVKPIKRNDLREALLKAISARASDAVAEPAAGTPTKVHPLRILLADDSLDNRTLILAYLKKSPHRIEVAENGVIAVEKFCADTFDLVLMDMQMPEMDGYTATAQIRAWEQQQGREKTPILALTAYAQPEDRQKSLDAGCNAHLTKPIKKSELLSALSQYNQD